MSSSGDTLTPRHLRRSPFATNSGSTSIQRLLDNQRSGLSVNSNGQNVPPSSFNLLLKVNSPGQNRKNIIELHHKLIKERSI
ncbi:hypothetical protein ACTXT7_011745 [Hymenolepis weldensis]